MPIACPARLLLGAVEWYAGNFVEAVGEYTRALELGEGESFGPLIGRGQVYAELGEYDLALADLDRAIALGHGQRELSANMACAVAVRWRWPACCGTTRPGANSSNPFATARAMLGCNTTWGSRITAWGTMPRHRYA